MFRRLHTFAIAYASISTISTDSVPNHSSGPLTNESPVPNVIPLFTLGRLIVAAAGPVS